MSWTDGIVQPNAESRLPLWVHWLLRIILQIAVGYAAYSFWMAGHLFWSILFAVFFVYLIAVLFYGEELRNYAIEQMNKI